MPTSWSRLTEFTGQYPYATELVGVYQPIEGWKAKSIEDRLLQLSNGQLKEPRLFGEYRLVLGKEGPYSWVTGIDLNIGTERPPPRRKLPQTLLLLKLISRELPSDRVPTPDEWSAVLAPDRIDGLLKNFVVAELKSGYESYWHTPSTDWMKELEARQRLELQLDRESIAAANLLRLMGKWPLLDSVFYAPMSDAPAASDLTTKEILNRLKMGDDISRICLSPIGLIHLTRQYFFELGSFLGSPVNNICVFPGSKVESSETTTLRSVFERTLEFASDSIDKSESVSEEKDELADVLREENRNDVRFGASVSANQSWIIGGISQTASFELNSTRQEALEVTRKSLRQHSTKVAGELRRRSRNTRVERTERTVESGKKYTIESKPDTEIQNYELRRKMRRVAVQVQDVGTYLSWQAYVDDPGSSLGIAKLLHIAATPDVGTLPHPELLPLPQPLSRDYAIDIPLISTVDEGSLDDEFRDGVEVHTDFLESTRDQIQADFTHTVVCDHAKYRLASVTFDTTGVDASIKCTSINQSQNTPVATFAMHLSHVNFHGRTPLRVTAKLQWMPEDAFLKEIVDENSKRTSTFTRLAEEKYKREFVDAARERIKLASSIVPRKYEDLREEERIVVYRNLIQGILLRRIAIPNEQTRHVLAEMITSIFDIDKMLYFVAPEWWRPRFSSRQEFGSLRPSGKTASNGDPEMVPTGDTQLSAEHVVGWGGTAEERRDNYFITDESSPARLGSSLGWLLQLDGDNLRNAFLNAPWVKAVLPIRPGKEQDAIDWLEKLEGNDGLDEIWQGEVTRRQALSTLAADLAKRHSSSREVDKAPIGDPENTVLPTPIDRVFEHGFKPLFGGFRADPISDFAVYDQWIEVVPTDQTVAVPVQYGTDGNLRMPELLRSLDRLA